MRLSFFTQWWPPEPASLVASLATELSRRGHLIDVVTGFPNYPSGRVYPGYRMRWRRVECRDGPRVIRVPLYPSHDRSAVGRALNYATFGLAASTVGFASVRHPDAAYVYHPTLTSAWPARLQRRLHGIPYVLHVQDLWPDSVFSSGMVGGRARLLLERTLSRMCMATYKAAAHIVVISPGFKEALVDRGVVADKITVVFNWADDEVFTVGEPDMAARAELGPPDSRLVIYAGNMGDYQGLDAVVRAAASVGDRSNVHLALVGDGIARPRLEELVKTLGASNVRLLPQRSAKDIVPLLAAADAHLVSLTDLPFFASTIPGKTPVALASAKFTLMAVRGDAADLIDRAGAGITCEPSEEGLTSAFDEFGQLENEEIERRGRAGRAYYEHHLSMKLGVNQFESIFNSLSGRPAGG